MGKELHEKVSKVFEKTRKKFLFSDVAFDRAIELPELTIIVCNGKIGSLIGKKGVIVGHISKELGNRVRIVENSKNHRKIITDMMGNASLLGINELFEEGNKAYKIIINNKDRQKLIAPINSLETALQELTGCKTQIGFR